MEDRKTSVEEFTDQAFEMARESNTDIERYVWKYAVHLLKTIDNGNDVMKAYEPPWSGFDDAIKEGYSGKLDYIDYPIDRDDRLRSIIIVRAMMLKRMDANAKDMLDMLDSMLLDVVA